MPDQTAIGASINEINKYDLYISKRDRLILRELAIKIVEISKRPFEEEKTDSWTKHNDLQPARPMIFCDPENGWNEIITEQTMKCDTKLGREWENTLRKEICWAEQMKDDKVVDSNFYVPYVAAESDWGMKERRIGGEHCGDAYSWESPLKKYDDMVKLHFPNITVDYDSTGKLKRIAEDVFEGLLYVQIKHKWWWTLGMTWTLVNLRGLETIMFDMYDYPDKFHELMSFLRDGHLKKLDFLEQNGLLPDNTGNTYVGSGGFGFTNQLPTEGFTNNRIRTADMWGFCESQETVSVSPEMFGEYIFPYQFPILERFGLNCYGCCEPLEKRWKWIERIPNLRRVSVSPWANAEEMAEQLEDKYIYSYKPNPAYLAVSQIDEDLIRRELRRILEIAKNSVLEIIMKDNNTLGNNPNNAYRWVEIARQEINDI